MEAEFLSLLSAGGDVSVIAIAFLLWRLDRRVSRLEYAEEFRKVLAGSGR